ncbi:uncharacterized protein LTR77_001527 [Saxophila tyrrhenica]|uniref:Ubiquitin-conjugating enzyme E2C-binding protein n=1 Tax=Saxophila tyrrhenica TaxID=1690608 RepID=A0AAV9PQ54_9PEZI|nr:hypothetical protein LTR77_001527 [Saxophila tyrrhenica]
MDGDYQDQATMIHLYVEHLINIRTLSLQASLATVSNKETKATLSADGSLLTLTHEGQTASITLPVNLSPNRQSNVIFTIPAIPSRDLSFRIQLEEKELKPDSKGFLPNGQSDDGNVIPWTADTLTADTAIRCRMCDMPLLERGKVQTWKDLPSEGWAEMMEFWHCHKPHEPHAHENGEGEKKGYAAGSQLALEAGVGMVDPLDFLLLPVDCANVEVRASQIDSLLECTQCNSTIGHVESTTGGYRLRKLNLSVSSREHKSSVSYDKQKWLACLLLCAMDTKGVRKFIVHVGDKTMKLWLFTPDLTISSSASESPEPTRVVKVLWQELDPSEQDIPERLTAASLAEDELRVLDEEAQTLHKLLDDSAQLLPEGARKFQDWNVGLLQRFTAADIKPL